MKWKAELVETLSDGAQTYRIVKPKPEPPKQLRRFVADYKTRFMELYGQGLNDREIGEELGFHQSGISGFRRKLGLPVNEIRWKIVEAEFLRLYELGISDHKIAKAFGVTPSSVSDYRRRRGLPAHFKFGKGKPGLTHEEKRRIRELHGQGLPITKIAEEISRSYPLIKKFCNKEKLEISRSRGKGYEKVLRGEKLLDYLKEHGPTPQSTLSEELEIPAVHFPVVAREMFDQVERFQFKVGANSGRGGTKFGGTRIYGELNVKDIGSVFALRDDPRIVVFVAEGVPFKVKDTNDARTLVQHLKKQIGTERARQVVEKLGYQYQQKASTPRKKRIRPLDGLHQIEILEVSC